MASASIVAMNSRGGGKRTYHRGEGEARLEDIVFSGQKYGSGSNKSLSHVSMKFRLPHAFGWESEAGLCLPCAQVKEYRSTTGSMERRQTTMALWLAFILMCFYVCQCYLYKIDATETVIAALTNATRMHPCCCLS